MKILKMYVQRIYGNTHYYCVFDEIPKITYEKIGVNYIGSAIDEKGDIIFSDFLKMGRSGAFAGREFSLIMKDGSVEKIKNYWWSDGPYSEHGQFISVGGGTIEELQKCYVYSGYYINKQTFEKMLNEYYSREREYEYREIEKWVKMQHKWYNVTINGVKYPYMVNKYGLFVHKYTKEPVYLRRSFVRYFKRKNGEKNKFPICIFYLEYKDENRLIKIERNMLEVLRESLPDYSDEEIIANCNLTSSNLIICK